MKSKKMLPALLLVIFVLLLIILIYRTNSSEKIKFSEEDFVLGSKRAPVTIVMFSRYSCTASKDFINDYIPRIQKDYIDAGRVKLVYKNLYQQTQKEALSAEAGLCANDQGKFWEYSSVLFSRVGEWLPKLEDENKVSNVFNPILLQYADAFKLNNSLFSDCLYQHKYLEKIRKDYNEAWAWGVEETPTFIINGLLIEGKPKSFEDFEALLLKFRYD